MQGAVGRAEDKEVPSRAEHTERLSSHMQTNPRASEEAPELSAVRIKPIFFCQKWKYVYDKVFQQEKQKEVIISHDFDRKIALLVAFGIEQKGSFILLFFVF